MRTFKVRVNLPFRSERESNIVEVTWESDWVQEQNDLVRERVLGKENAETLAQLRSLGAIDYPISSKKIVLLEDAKRLSGDVYARKGSKLEQSRIHFL